MNLFRRKCCFCGDRNSPQPLERVAKSWCYSSIIHNYHETCRYDVLRHPERYGNRTVDIALEIDECLAYDAARLKEKLAEREQRLQKARERMAE